MTSAWAAPNAASPLKLTPIERREVIGVDGVNAACADLAAGHPGYRYVIDMTPLS